MPHGEQLQSPNCTDVEAGAGVKARRKKTRLASANVKNDKDMVPSTSSAIVHVLDDPLQSEVITSVDGKEPVKSQK